MQQSDAKMLFHLQAEAELVDKKVEIAVNQAISQVVAQIIDLKMDLKQEIHRKISGLRHEMHEMKHEIVERFSKVEGRLSAVETALGMRHQIRTEIRTRFFDYAFKAGWLILGSVLTYGVVHSHIFFQ